MSKIYCTIRNKSGNIVSQSILDFENIFDESDATNVAYNVMVNNIKILEEKNQRLNSTVNNLNNKFIEITEKVSLLSDYCIQLENYNNKLTKKISSLNIIYNEMYNSITESNTRLELFDKFLDFIQKTRDIIYIM